MYLLTERNISEQAKLPEALLQRSLLPVCVGSSVGSRHLRVHGLHRYHSHAEVGL